MSSQLAHEDTQGLATPCGCGCAGNRDRVLARVGELVASHRTHLLRVARAEGLLAADAFDAVQEAFQRYLGLPQAASLEDVDGARRLLVTLTRNEARNRRRLHAVARPHERDDRRLAEIAADAPTVEELLVAAEEHVRLRSCVRTLADVQRAVVTLRMLEEASTEDVARHLGLSAGHVAVLLHRAKANLAACMTEEIPSLPRADSEG